VISGIWLDKEKTSPYKMYQYFINAEDSKVIEYLKMLTFISVDEIKNLEISLKNEPEKRLAQKTLAYEVVKFVHGEEEANNSRNTSEEVFTKGYSEEGMPEESISKSELTNILDLLVVTKLSVSKSEAKRLVDQNGISINNEKVSNSNIIIDETLFKNGYIILSKGKKIHIKVNLK
jgi:tyrosyl-tRNA synthetase